jgi:hypothetical protein
VGGVEGPVVVFVSARKNEYMFVDFAVTPMNISPVMVFRRVSDKNNDPRVSLRRDPKIPVFFSLVLSEDLSIRA